MLSHICPVEKPLVLWIENMSFQISLKKNINIKKKKKIRGMLKKNHMKCFMSNQVDIVILTGGYEATMTVKVFLLQ